MAANHFKIYVKFILSTSFCLNALNIQAYVKERGLYFGSKGEHQRRGSDNSLK